MPYPNASQNPAGLWLYLPQASRINKGVYPIFPCTQCYGKNMTLHKKFSIKDFFNKCDQVRSFLSILVTFTEDILNGKFFFFVV